MKIIQVEKEKIVSGNDFFDSRPFYFKNVAHWYSYYQPVCNNSVNSGLSYQMRILNLKHSKPMMKKLYKQSPVPTLASIGGFLNFVPVSLDKTRTGVIGLKMERFKQIYRI